MELLAPAGNVDALRAAVEAGADAVYLGGNTFGARAYANNFSEKELENAVRFAHLRNVHVHVTVNTLIKTEELAKLTSFLVFLYEIGVDAILVQDLGVATLAKKIVPKLPLHASTQMSVHNLAGVLSLEEFGFTRVVLARELSLEEIRYIIRHSGIEIEVFTHGAICISYSGQCLMSSMIGGRSGNRGRCAQPCRLPYKLKILGEEISEDIEGKYLLSPKDLNTLAILPQLLEAGVASLKIEGRMKRPEYVAIVTDVYRRTLDSILQKAQKEKDPSPLDSKKDMLTAKQEDKRRLRQIFNRDFTSAYLEGHVNKDMMSTTRPNNRGVFIGRVLSYAEREKRVFVKLVEDIHEGDEVDIWVKVGGRVTEKVSDLKDASGKKKPSIQKGQIASFPLHIKVRENNRIFRLFDAELMCEAKSFFQKEIGTRRIFVRAYVRAKIGEPLYISFQTGKYKGEAKSHFIGEIAQTRPLEVEMIKANIMRIGNTVYTLKNPLTGAMALVIDMDKDVMFPLSEINIARRLALEKLDAMRLSPYKREKLIKIPKITFEAKKEAVERVKIAISLDTLEKVGLALKYGADIILFGGDSYAGYDLTPSMYEKAAYMTKEKGKEFSILTPRIVREEHLAKMRALLENCRGFAQNIKAIYVHNMGMAHFVKKYVDSLLHADFSMNVCNSLTLKTLKDLGFSGATLSPELTMEEVAKLGESNPWHKGTNLECIVHGRVELMLSAYNLVLNELPSAKHVLQDEKKYSQIVLEDRKGENFPVRIDQFSQMHILNAKTLSMLPYAMKFAPMGIRSIRILGKAISENKYQSLLEAYRQFLTENARETKSKEHENLAKKREQELMHADFTRGHYFRGIF